MMKLKSGIMSRTVDLGQAGELEVTVKYTYSPGTKDVMYLPNGDPGYPGDPAVFDVLEISCEGINITDLLVGNAALMDEWAIAASEICMEEKI